jgi:pilus assembly protein CpaB
MKAARLVVLVIALGAGGVAAMLAGRSKTPDVKPVAAVKPDTVDILVAKSDIGLGQPVSAGDLSWQPWPASAATGNFIRKTDRPDAIQKMSGEIARAPFVAGEPIRDAKLVDAHGSGYMAAILPSGMRAVSTQISPETGAGGFILPNDRVDVILTKRDADKGNSGDGQTSETILTNVRVLAIDQNIAEKNGQRVVVGKTATLELTPSQAETLTMGQRLGTLALSLRSLADASDTTKPDVDTGKKKAGGSVNVIRFGIGSTVTTR